MRWFTKWRHRFQSLFDRSRVEDDLEDELRDYIERETERKVRGGATPEEARRSVPAGLDGTDRLKEDCRDARGVRWLEDTLGDVRFAVRTLHKAPAFTMTVIAALAFLIGVNTAIFSVVDTVLFRPLPFPNQDRLVAVTEGVPGLGFPVLPFSCPDYLFVAANNRSFAATGTYGPLRQRPVGVGIDHRHRAAMACEFGGKQDGRSGFTHAPFWACEHYGWHINPRRNTKSGTHTIRKLPDTQAESEGYWRAFRYPMDTGEPSDIHRVLVSRPIAEGLPVG